jgi:hypothetical protein
MPRAQWAPQPALRANIRKTYPALTTRGVDLWQVTRSTSTAGVVRSTKRIVAEEWVGSTTCRSPASDLVSIWAIAVTMPRCAIADVRSRFSTKAKRASARCLLARSLVPLYGGHPGGLFHCWIRNSRRSWPASIASRSHRGCNPRPAQVSPVTGFLYLGGAFARPFFSALLLPLSEVLRG